MRCVAADMENSVQNVANGHAIGSRVESTEEVTCKPVANGNASDADRLDAKDDVKQFLDDARASADVEREDSDEADAEMSDEEVEESTESYTGCDRVEPLRLADSLWKLDRRASGHLFWRRDSSTLQDGVDPSSRVKFRYDVTVREYAEQQQESDRDDEEDSAEEQEIEDPEGFALRQRKRLVVTPETDKENAKSTTGWAASPIVIYSAVFLAMLMAAVIHWYLWGRTAWANFTGARRGGSV